MEKNFGAAFACAMLAVGALERARSAGNLHDIHLPDSAGSALMEAKKAVDAALHKIVEEASAAGVIL